MKEQLITFKTAKLAKEKGFDIPIQHTIDGIHQLYDIDNNEISINSNAVDNWNKFDTVFSAPTQSLLQKWFWETYSIHISIVPLKRRNERQIYFQYRVVDFREIYDEDEVLYEHQYNNSFDEFTKPEEALEKGLQEGLKLIKTK